MEIVKFEGLIAAPFTPMDPHGQIKPGHIPRLAKNLKENNVLGAFIIGSTGEGVSLTLEEKRRVIEAWQQEQEENFKVIALIASNSLQEARELAQFAQHAGVYGIAILPPFYFKIANTQKLVDYFRELAGTVPGMPVYYYHIPALTGVDLPMHEFLTKARDVVNLAGIKYTAADLFDYRKCLTFDNERYDILWGIDEILISAMAMGARGGVGSTYNYAAPLYIQMMKAFQDGNLDKARSLQSKSIEIVDILTRHGGIATGKYFMKHIGLDCGEFRAPVGMIEDPELFEADLQRIDFDRYSSVGQGISEKN